MLVFRILTPTGVPQRSGRPKQELSIMQPQEEPQRPDPDRTPGASVRAQAPHHGAPKALAQWPPPGVGAAALLHSRSRGGAPPVLSGVPVLPKSVGSDLGFMQFMARVNKLGTSPPDPFLSGLEGAPTSLPPAATWQAPNPNQPTATVSSGGNGTHVSPRKWRDPFKLVNGQHVLEEQFESFMASVQLPACSPPRATNHGFAAALLLLGRSD